MHEAEQQSVAGAHPRAVESALRTQVPCDVLLETTSPSNDEEDFAGVRLRTPPGGTQPVEDGTDPLAPLRREIVTDVGCVKALGAALSDQSAAFQVVTADIAWMLSTGTASTLGKSTIVIGPVLANGMAAAEAVEQLRALVPHVGVYVVASETAEVARLLPRLAAAGVDEVFCLDSRSDMDALEETLRLRLSAPPPETEIRLLWKWFRESPERSLVMHCVRNGYRLDVWSIRSRVFNACRKTLQNRMSVMGLPSPGILSRCGRVLHAQELERRGVRPTAVVADILGFPSSGAMQRARRRLRKALMTRGRQALVFASLLK